MGGNRAPHKSLMLPNNAVRRAQVDRIVSAYLEVTKSAEQQDRIVRARDWPRATFVRASSREIGQHGNRTQVTEQPIREVTGRDEGCLQIMGQRQGFDVFLQFMK